MNEYRITTNFKVGLSQAEIDALDEIVLSGDRGTFYLAYNGFTNSDEAILTLSISTFSEATGAIAYAANFFGQQQFAEAGPDGDNPYRGVYLLSQQIAEKTLRASEADAGNDDFPILDGQNELPHDGAADGVVSDQRLFNAAFNAWSEANNEQQFPGNFCFI